MIEAYRSDRMLRTKLARLKHEARSAAKFHGHELTNFVEKEHGVYDATCKKCCAWVQIRERPQANGIDCGGTALALGCT